jgi:NADPH:quinone reductase-like Zn-dependent oxidoreductase
VIGASGGVGSFAVQLAVSVHATVTAVASAAKADFVRSLGAPEVLDYRADSYLDSGRTYDAIIDIAGNAPLAQLRRTLTPRGTLVIVGGEGGGQVLGGLERNLAAAILSPFVGQKLMGLVATERATDFAELAALIEAGTITPAIDRVVPLSDAADAVRALRAGELRGKAVVEVIPS